MGKRLYVGNLPYDATEDAIRAAFSAGGCNVARVHIPLDRETQRPRGFAFVEMRTDEEAQQALAAMNGAVLGTRTLRVSEAEERRPGGGGPGGPGAGGPPRSSSPPRPSGAPRPERPRGTTDVVSAPRVERRDGSPGGGGGGGDDDRTARFGPDARPHRERERERERERDARRATGRRRQDGEGEEFHGRRGGRRFDDDDDEE